MTADGWTWMHESVPPIGALCEWMWRSVNCSTWVQEYDGRLFSQGLQWRLTGIAREQMNERDREWLAFVDSIYGEAK